MRLIRTNDFRRPMFYAVGWGIQIASVMFLFALLISSSFEHVPFVVRAAPAVGFLAAVVLMVLGGYRQPSDRDASS